MNRTLVVATVLCALLLPAAAPAEMWSLKSYHHTLCELRDGPGYEEGTYERGQLDEQIAGLEYQIMQACWDEAVEAFDAGDFGTAIARFDEIIAWGGPDDEESYCFSLGHAHYHYAMTHDRDSEHLEAAARAYRDAYAWSESGDVTYRVLEARALAALGREADARRALDHFTDNVEDPAYYWTCRAEAFSLLGDAAEEQACLERAAGGGGGTYEPSSPQPQPAPASVEPAFSAEEVSAAEVYLEGQEAFDRGDYATAAELFRRSLNIADDVWVWVMLGQCYDALGDAQQAENCYARVEGREPRILAPGN
jgi:tetratricopeptide (TPR) repeat protein